MRYICAAAIAALPFAPVVLTGVPSAHADYDGYTRCVVNMQGLRPNDPDPNNMYLAGLIEQDLKNGVSPAAEGQKVTRMGFEPHYANGIVQCAMRNNP